MTHSELLKSIRKYFWRRGFVEVEVSYLNPNLPLEPNLYAFKTTWKHQKQTFYLPTSPELALKKHLSQNRQKCFAIGHCFRDLEACNELHNPEFLMLEWYLPDQNLADLIKFTKKFVRHFLKIDFTEFKLPPNLPQKEADFNQYFLNEIEPKLPRHGGTFVTGYPAYLSPLAKPVGNSTGQTIADRFELYINGIEIANGCVENTDANSIKSAFEAEKEYRRQHHLPLHPISIDFIDYCSRLSLCSGVGLGIDRFLNLLK